MADIHVPQKGAKRSANTTRIDFTPMVDLGFILITFFIYTTTMAKQKALVINMPSNEPTQTQTAFIEESTITLIPVEAHKVAYYNGALAEKEQIKITSIDKIRNILLNKKMMASALPDKYSKEAHQLHVIIKPADNCKYDDVVRLLDEMNINDVPYYAIADITAEEYVMLTGIK